jgi:hypothetical protein
MAAFQAILATLVNDYTDSMVGCFCIVHVVYVTVSLLCVHIHRNKNGNVSTHRVYQAILATALVNDYTDLMVGCFCIVHVVPVAVSQSLYKLPKFVLLDVQFFTMCICTK